MGDIQPRDLDVRHPVVRDVTAQISRVRPDFEVASADVDRHCTYMHTIVNGAHSSVFRNDFKIERSIQPVVWIDREEFCAGRSNVPSAKASWIELRKEDKWTDSSKPRGMQFQEPYCATAIVDLHMCEFLQRKAVPGQQ